MDASRKQINVHVVIRKELKNCVHAVLRPITLHMIPSAFFNSIIKLLGGTDGNVKKKVLPVMALFSKDGVKKDLLLLPVFGECFSPVSIGQSNFGILVLKEGTSYHLTVNLF